MPSNYLPTPYQEFIHLSRYSRWLPDKNRRETWDETVSRYFDFFTDHLKEMHDFKFSANMRKELEEAVLDLRVMPSMRCLMTAGEALKRENIAGYNCSYVAVNRVHAFDEILYILMNGTGVGFSVERQHVSQLPHVADEFHHTDTTITVADSKLGWAKAYKELLSLLWSGNAYTEIIYINCENTQKYPKLYFDLSDSVTSHAVFIYVRSEMRDIILPTCHHPPRHFDLFKTAPSDPKAKKAKPSVSRARNSRFQEC